MSNLDWRAKTLLAGGAAGALLGVVAAFVYVKSVEDRAEGPDLDPAGAVAIGLSVLGVLRQIAALPDSKKLDRR